MKIGRVLRVFPVFLLAAVFLFGCAGKNAKASNSGLYLRYNIHVQNKVRRNGDHIYSASYANYTDPGSGHIIIPAGSKIEIKHVSSREFSFLAPQKGIKVKFEYSVQRMGMSVKEYIQKITSPTPVSLAGFSKVDRNGIAQGKALVGMTRAGVMTALGYPAAHRTPSLDASTYIYWTNRFGTVAVKFDNQGKVKKITN